LPNVRVTRNIPRKEFVNMLRSIDLLVGNSSMALLEGAFLKIPAINVGHRNKNRMNSGNVVFAEPTIVAIKRVLNKILHDVSFRNKLKKCKSIYGDGGSANRIIKVLKKLGKKKTELTAKNITY